MHTDPELQQEVGRLVEEYDGLGTQSEGLSTPQQWSFPWSSSQATW
jgi:hypothetical protein